MIPPAAELTKLGTLETSLVCSSCLPAPSLVDQRETGSDPSRSSGPFELGICLCPLASTLV